jgi:hypothetical protein
MFHHAQVSVKWKSINNFAVREMISLHKYFLKPEFFFISIPIGHVDNLKMMIAQKAHCMCRIGRYPVWAQF